MPTIQVEPDANEYLQDVANSLLKARKVVVVTGAGISTNSGIPDFRSENGLYSLIQAQFDNAARQFRPEESTVGGGNADEDNDSDASTDASEDSRASKRRRVSRDDNIEVTTEPEEIKDEITVGADSITVLPAHHNESKDLQDTAALPPLGDTIVCTPKPMRSLETSLIATSPLSSPPADIAPPSIFRRRSHNHMLEIAVHSSSPLSSPPPNLFDPYDRDSEGSPSRRSSTSHSDIDDTFPSNPLSSQTSLGGRNSLPNMKGKDLFDASIWADPLRTSVFYTFATSLRQKIRDCEPTSSHHFISHLRNRGKLVRCYTQNIDRIEEKVGLSTSLQDGPGSRGRFSRRSTANASQLSKMVEEESAEMADTTQDFDSSQMSIPASQAEGSGTPNADPESQDAPIKVPSKPPKLQPSRSSGVECVFLHGSLECLRCFLCGRISSWDSSLEYATMSGQQPECPHCIGATAAREERGKRALGVGKLRPDIVLYGEEHPNAHLISPIVTHDLSLCPDLLLILGTSLRVHGLKVLVREFAKAIHNRGGKVVFVNFTKPPESSWGDVIDYWVQWDCDAWVSDLQNRVPKLWEDPPPPKRKKTEEEKEKEKRDRPPPANPMALRNTNATGAYWTLKIRDELYRITGTPSLVWRANGSEQESASKDSVSVTPVPAALDVKSPTSTEEAITVQTKVEIIDAGAGGVPAVEANITVAEKTSVAPASRPKPKRARKSAPGALERAKKQQQPSTLNPDHGRAKKSRITKPPPQPSVERPTQLPTPPKDLRTSINSILNSVKEHPRIRKRKKIDGEEIILPVSKASKQSRNSTPQTEARVSEARVTLAPITNAQPPTPPQLDTRPKPMEPSSPPLGPPGIPGPAAGPARSFITARLTSAMELGKRSAEHLQEFFNLRHSWTGVPKRAPAMQQSPYPLPMQQGYHRSTNERDAAQVLTELRLPAEYRW